MLELHPHKGYLLAQLQDSTVNGIVLHCFSSFFWSWFQLMLMKRKVLLAHSSWFLGFFKAWHSLHCCLRSSQSCWVRSFHGTRWDIISMLVISLHFCTGLNRRCGGSSVLVSGGCGSLDGEEEVSIQPSLGFLEPLVLDNFPFLFWRGLYYPKQNPCAIWVSFWMAWRVFVHRCVVCQLHPFLNQEALHTVLHVFVTSWVDYCK